MNCLQRYAGHPFRVVIYNDNTDILTEQDIANFGYTRGNLTIINNQKNLGCFHARWNCLEYMREYPEIATEYFMFLDSDDQVIDINFGTGKEIVNHNGVVVKRLTEVLDILRAPTALQKLLAEKNEFIEPECPKTGCVGVLYRPEMWYAMMDLVRDFLPQLYELYGSKRILEPDDVIYMNLIRMFMEHRLVQSGAAADYAAAREILFNDAHPLNPYERTDNYSYALTMIEARAGRYAVESGVTDFRYGISLHRYKTYEDFYNTLSERFYKYLENLG
jgi:hypothetical protein